MNDSAQSNAYRVLGALLALRECTVGDIATFASVDRQTADSVLSREGAAYVNVDARSEFARRYRILPGAEAGLRARLEEIENSSNARFEHEQIYGGGIPASLAVAEDLLFNRVTRISDPLERSSFTGMARLAFEDSQSLVGMHSLSHSARLMLHRNLVECALNLSEAEVTVAMTGLVDEANLANLRLSFANSLSEAAMAGDPNMVKRLSNRFLSSPLGQFIARVDLVDPVQSILQPRPVLFFGDAGMEIPNSPAKGVSDRVRKLLTESHITFVDSSIHLTGDSRLRVTQQGIICSPAAETAEDAPRMFGLRSYYDPVHPVCIIPLVSGDPDSYDALEKFNDVCSEMPNRLVFGDTFDANLNNTTFGNFGRFVPLEGLSHTGFSGAIFNGWTANSNLSGNMDQPNFGISGLGEI